jgi:hypothetical protein
VCPFSTNERLRGKRKNRPDHVFPEAPDEDVGEARHREDLHRTKVTKEQRHYSRIDGEVQDRTPDFPPRQERILRQQSKGICYHSRTVHSQCEEQIGK